jgi:hypothetical protein
MTTFRAHLWSHALSSMVLPEEALSLHSFLEAPTTSTATPAFVANWKFNLLRPVICNLLASLADDYDVPPEALTALISLLTDESTCDAAFSVRLLSAPGRITHSHDLLPLLHDCLVSNASIDCCIHFTGSAAIEFKRIVNSIVTNTSFYQPPPTPSFANYVASDRDRSTISTNPNVTTRPATVRAGVSDRPLRGTSTVSFEPSMTGTTPTPQAPMTGTMTGTTPTPPAPMTGTTPTPEADTIIPGPSVSWTNRRSSSSNFHHLSPIPDHQQTHFRNVDRSQGDPLWDSFARDDFTYHATSPSEVYARRRTAASASQPTILRHTGSGGSRSSTDRGGGGPGRGHSPYYAGGFGRGGGGRAGRPSADAAGGGRGLSANGPSLFDPLGTSATRSSQGGRFSSYPPGGGDGSRFGSSPSKQFTGPSSFAHADMPGDNVNPGSGGSFSGHGNGGSPGGGGPGYPGGGGDPYAGYGGQSGGSGNGGPPGGGGGGGGPGHFDNHMNPDGSYYKRGATWTQFRVDNTSVDMAINQYSGTISPWIATRPDYNTIICHALPLNLRQHDKAVFLSAFGRSPFDSNAIKEFLRNFPVFPATGDPQYLLLPYFTRVVSYCTNFGVYVPPSHTLSSGDILGRWFIELPRGVQFLVQNSFAGFLAQAFQNKHTGLLSHPSVRAVLQSQDDDGYLMYYQMHVLANHPLLLSYPSQDVEPRQSADMTIGVYLQRWLHYVHIQLLHGVFVSDRYYLLQLVANLYPSFRDSLGRLLSSDALEKVSDINRALPNSFAPDQIHIKLVELARHAGRPQLIIKTPRELHRPTREIRELNVDPEAGFRHMMAQVSAPTTGYGPRRCFFCGKEDCTLLTCKTATAAKNDSFVRRSLVKYFGISALDFAAAFDEPLADDPAGESPALEVSDDLLGLDLGSPPPFGTDESPTPDFR